jgi:hypothetical protein
LASSSLLYTEPENSTNDGPANGIKETQLKNDGTIRIRSNIII